MARKSHTAIRGRSKSVTLRVPVDLLREIEAEAADRAESKTDVILRRLAGRRASVRDGFGEAYALYLALRELNNLREDHSLQNDPNRAAQVKEMFDVIHDRFFSGVKTNGRR